MQKLSRNLERLKNSVNNSKNRNIRFVNVRAIRQCKYCGNLIWIGDTCLTVNKKKEGRRWICLSCVDAVLEYKKTKAQMNCVPFGDEGAYLALCDFAAEQEAELYDRGILN